jgi:hypothetical protein
MWISPTGTAMPAIPIPAERSWPALHVGDFACGSFATADSVQAPQGKFVPYTRLEPWGPATYSSELPAPENNNNIHMPPMGIGAQPPVPTRSPNAGTGQGVDGTWHEDPNYVVITIDGREVRLRKSDLGPRLATSAPAIAAEVRGRLLQNGAPLVNCRVVLVAMEREGVPREPLVSITDEEGVYRFANVPAGEYKLTWLPDGTRQWIRRIQMTPDVIVQAGQDVVVKDIRAALRTIN